MVTKVAIDAGHGRDGDPGAVGPSGLQEADVTLRLADFLERELKPSGMTVFRLDRDLVSSQRAQVAAQNGCDLLLSLHCNAGGPSARGAEVWFGHGNAAGKDLARCLWDPLLAETKVVSRGIKDDGDWRPAVDPGWTGGMGVLRGFPGPAVLVELLFLSNPEEEAMLADSGFLIQAAKALGRGVVSFCGTLTQPVFPDVPPDLWNGQAGQILQTLVDRGIFVGYEDGSFHPHQPITRLECAAAIYRALALLGAAKGNP
jgi:N-acetylmuramoyl-L-alanine amidase